MVLYYNSHRRDFKNPLHNLSNINIQLYNKRPNLQIYAVGILVYLSTKSCNYLIEHMNAIDYNIFLIDNISNSYPYIIEDIGVAYILYKNNIPFTFYRMARDTCHQLYIGCHTNEFR